MIQWQMYLIKNSRRKKSVNVDSNDNVRMLEYLLLQ